MKKKLGRSPLDAFLSKPKKKVAGESTDTQSIVPEGEFRKLPIEFMQPGQYQLLC